MDTAESRSRRWAVALLACLIAGARVLTTAAAFQLAIVAASTVMAGSIVLAAVIALSGRSLW